jgi:hypothetical protein
MKTLGHMCCNKGTTADTAKQIQILKQIRTQLPLADGTFISHSVYKFWGKVNCKIVNTLW